MKTILFIGDSITDAGRERNDDRIMGYGYATMTAGKIGCDYPGAFRFFNRGINGNRSIDLYARLKRDIINLKPDYMSIHVGVNDVWHELDFCDGISAKKYEKIMDALLQEIKAALPDIKIIFMEPFVLRGKGTERYFEEFEPEVRQRARIVKEIAEKHGFPFVPLQGKLEELVAKTSSETVLLDGVHPTYVGHELISRELYQAYRAILQP